MHRHTAANPRRPVALGVQQLLCSITVRVEGQLIFKDLISLALRAVLDSGSAWILSGRHGR